MVRKYVRAERERRGWSQADLARAAGRLSRTTVADLENGRILREGKEAAIERALGWQIGSLDVIRNGGQPVTSGEVRLAGEPDLRDEVERQLWAITDLPESDRWEYIYLHRAREQRRRATGIG